MASTGLHPSTDKETVGTGLRTLMRGVDAIAYDTMSLSELAYHPSLTKSTTHRLASALAERGYLAFTPLAGHRMGPELLERGALAPIRTDIIQVARRHLEALSSSTEDTVHLGVLEGDRALYLDKMPGRRRITISNRVGDRQPLTSTGLGKALMLDRPFEYRRERFEADQAAGSHPADRVMWEGRMRSYVEAGRAFDLEEDEDQSRCVAAPVRDAKGAIVSVSSAAQYMGDDRMLFARHGLGRMNAWQNAGKPVEFHLYSKVGMVSAWARREPPAWVGSRRFAAGLTHRASSNDRKTRP